MRAGSQKGRFNWVVLAIGLVTIVAVLPLFLPLKQESVSSPKVHARAIASMMFAYANDHGGVYPTGRSSTEVFQRLVDGGYASDPSIFFEVVFLMPGKIKATSKKLKPENVCWDTTTPVNSSSPDSLPLVFSTGYQIKYVSGGDAVARGQENDIGIEICYKNGTIKFQHDHDSHHDGVLHNVVPTDFKSDGKKYEQLTPNGPLTP